MNPETGDFCKLMAESLKNAKPGDFSPFPLFADTGERVPASWPIFTIGDEYEINGHKFRLRKIDGKDLVLRPVVGQPHNYMKSMKSSDPPPKPEPPKVRVLKEGEVRPKDGS